MVASLLVQGKNTIFGYKSDTVREREMGLVFYLVMKPWGRWVKGRTKRFRRGSSQEAQRAAARSSATLLASPWEEKREERRCSGRETGVLGVRGTDQQAWEGWFEGEQSLSLSPVPAR